MDLATSNLQRSYDGRHSDLNGGTHKKKSPDLNEPGHLKMGILAEWHLHFVGSLPSSHSTKLQQHKKHLEAHMALKSLAKNHLIHLENPAPKHSNLGQSMQVRI